MAVETRAQAAEKQAMNAKARLWARLQPRGVSGCWLIDGAKLPFGHAKIRINGRQILAHRAAYRLWVGPIPDGMCVCHRCDVPACCNPAHLFLGTVGDNNRDRDAKGRGKLARGSVKTVPVQWHVVARALRAEGLTYRAIAGEMPRPVGASAVGNWINRRG